ncbi:MAG: 50S ribosomal protein L11 methyltransferase [Deltaproteobacteria bacterium]|nr:50S ribosomal protein L11 methyltransferase [Deltaproteobacteria bacterium]
MEKKWIEIALPVPNQWVDLVCECLRELGCCGVLVAERKLDTFIAPDPEELDSPVCWIRAYFPGGEENLAALGADVELGIREISRFTPGWVPPAIELRPVRDEAWAEGWKQHFRPFRVGCQLWICPTWENLPPDSGDRVIRIDPGMAFGTGSHATTRLCLESLAAVFDRQTAPAAVLDVGTGSGILAMAAVQLGSGAVLATDIDPEACEIARANIQLNGLASRIEVRCEVLERVEGNFDLIVANIFAEELVRLAPHFLRLLAAPGRLILSGILLEKAALVTNCFVPLLEGEPQVLEREDWCCLIFERG